MLLKIGQFGTTIDLSEHTGKLAVELDAPILKGDFRPKIEYFGVEGAFDAKQKELAPADYPENPDLWTFFIEPPIEAPPNQNRCHRYLVTHKGGDTYVEHPAYRSLWLTEHNSAKSGRCWELGLEGIKARIVMPTDFYMVEEIQTS